MVLDSLAAMSTTTASMILLLGLLDTEMEQYTDVFTSTTAVLERKRIPP